MPRLEAFYKIVNLIIIVTFLSLEAYLIHLISEQATSNIIFVFLTIGFVIVLVTVFKLIEYLIEKAIEECKFIRKIILKNEFIEGTWFDNVKIDGEDVYGLTTFTFNKGKYFQTGEQIFKDGTTRCSWNSVVADFQNNTLMVIYTVKYFDETYIVQPYGVSMYRFLNSRNENEPMIYIGSYFDIAEKNATKSTKGFKIQEENTIKKLYEPNSRNEILKTLMSSNYFSKI